MKVDYKVPFYSNTPDDTHCFQAALRMVLKYFKPQEEYSWEELDKLTAKVPELWTWQLAGLLWMQDHGFDAVDIETFDYDRFIKEGGDYLIDAWGEEVAKEQIKHSIIPQEIEFSKELLNRNIFTYKLSTVEMIKDYLDKEYLVVCLVNSQKLNNKEGYVGHFVVVKGYEDNNLILHDPGLPPQENRKVSFDQFEKAWAYPDERAKNIMAFKLER